MEYLYLLGDVIGFLLTQVVGLGKVKTLVDHVAGVYMNIIMFFIIYVKLHIW